VVDAGDAAEGLGAAAPEPVGIEAAERLREMTVGPAGGGRERRRRVGGGRHGYRDIGANPAGLEHWLREPAAGRPGSCSGAGRRRECGALRISWRRILRRRC